MTLLHIDTDLGVDDALALFAVTRIRGLRVGGLSSVFGNVPLDVASRNARLMRHLLAPALDVPLLTGASGPQGEAPEGDARSVHGDDGLGGATRPRSIPPCWFPAARPGDADLDLSAQIAGGPPPWLRPGEKITLVGLGPATNLPALARWYGSALARIVLLSGAFFDRGNITPAAEFNAWCDPPALAQTLALGVPVTFVPLDLCRKILLTAATIEDWQQRAPSPAMAFLGKAHRHYVESYRRTRGNRRLLPARHDRHPRCLPAGCVFLRHRRYRSGDVWRGPRPHAYRCRIKLASHRADRRRPVLDSSRAGDCPFFRKPAVAGISLVSRANVRFWGASPS